MFDTGKIVHLGISGYYRDRLKSGDTTDAVRLNDRPNIRIDGGNIADSGVITARVRSCYAGVEAAGVFGPLTVAGEAGRLSLDRFGPDDAHFSGYYGYASLHADRRDARVQRRQFRPHPAVQGARQDGLVRSRSRSLRPYRPRRHACARARRQ